MGDSVEISKYELKLKIVKFLEIAYDSDEQAILGFVRSAGPFKLRVSQNGKAILSGAAGLLTFSVSEEVKAIGVDFKYASIMFSGNKDGNLCYMATFGLGSPVRVSGALDVEKLVLSCSGLLCSATRAARQRYKVIQ